MHGYHQNPVNVRFFKHIRIVTDIHFLTDPDCSGVLKIRIDKSRITGMLPFNAASRKGVIFWLSIPAVYLLSVELAGEVCSKEPPLCFHKYLFKMHL